MRSLTSGWFTLLIRPNYRFPFAFYLFVTYLSSPYSLKDFDYNLPEELIAQYPLPERSTSRLLCLNRRGGFWQDDFFTNLTNRLQHGDLLVFNDTKVIPARLQGRKPTGGNVEILIERILDPHHVLAQTRSNHPLRLRQTLLLGDGRIAVTVLNRQGRLVEVACSDQENWYTILNSWGTIPLPPYIQRRSEEQDLSRYQTVYAQVPGAVAAPTAGLHFDQIFLNQLVKSGVKTAFLTLHVGAGTFLPVNSEDISSHVMHKEWIDLSESTCESIRETKAYGGRVIAVGTTVVRALESAICQGELTPYQGETQIFIRPGYPFQTIDALITNFHLPKSTLLMLVCALGGYDLVMAAYRHAVEQGYRFFSYGDAMLIEG